MSITVFLSCAYFCQKRLKYYYRRQDHQYDMSCIFCKKDNCPKTDNPITCEEFKMKCRSKKCYQKHKQFPVHEKENFPGKRSGPSECQKWWKCPACYKVIRTDKRKKEDHECGEYLCSTCDQYVMDDRLCYLRVTPPKENFIPKFICFDSECSKDEKVECEKGYEPVTKENCKVKR